jgi:acetyl-CoA carboxylase biotin carboxyl carrier protein
MNETGSEAKSVFDIERIRRLVELMEEHDLSEIELRQGEERIQLKRGATMPVPVAISQQAAAPQPAGQSTAAAPTTTSAPAPSAADDGRFAYIESPMVGTFYAKANPDAAAFVKVGDRVNAETVVCIVEAMKVFNEIPAGCSGVVAAVLVENEEPVEYGKKLFKIDTKA